MNGIYYAVRRLDGWHVAIAGGGVESKVFPHIYADEAEARRYAERLNAQF